MKAFVYVGNKLMYTKPLWKGRNCRMIMKLRALKKMGVYYYYDA